MGFTDYLTVEGQRLIAKSISNSLPITFTRVVMGTGYMNEGDVEKNVSEVITPAVTLNVTSVTMSGNESVIISTYFKNEELAEGFYFREKGIYLQVGAEEVLGIYGNAGSLAEYIDTAEVCIIEKMIRTVLTMSTDELENVTLLDGVSADTPIPFKEAEELEELKSGETLKVLFGKLAKGIKQLIAPEYTEATSLQKLVSGEKLSVAFGKIAKLVGSAIAHFATKATLNTTGHVKLSDSSAVTDSTGLALPATEKNAAIGGTLANQISKVNSDLGKKQDASTAINTSNIGNQTVSKATYASQGANNFFSCGYAQMYHSEEGGNFHATAPNGVAYGEMDAFNSACARMYFSADGLNETSGFYAKAGYCEMYLGDSTKASQRCRFNGNGIYPTTPSVVNVGNSDNPWKTVYAKSGTINTSDRTKKNNINDLTIVYEQLFMKLQPKSFMFNDGDRIHIGAISQDVEDSMNELGLTPEDFAGFCKDLRYKYTEFDENGDGIEESKEIEMDDDGNPVYNYSLRYQEFIFLTIHMLQKTIKRLDEVEERLAKLEEKLI